MTQEPSAYDSQQVSINYTPSQRLIHKRRSKNDPNDRNYLCGCGKRYLSYPALYTHVKTKHNGQNPSGTLAHQGNSKGRGRPKKTAENNEANQQIKEEEKDSKPGIFDDDNYFQTINIKPGPCNIDEAFAFMINSNTKEPQVYQYLYSLVKDNDGKMSAGVCTNCNLILISFLKYMQKYVCLDFMKSLIILIKYLRDCLNTYGWKFLYKGESKEADVQREYCNECNAEYLPDICNFFITQYLPQSCSKYDTHLAIKIVLYLCNWLNKNSFTSSRLTIL